MKNKRVIYNEFFDAYKRPYLKIVDHLNKKYNWEPALMFGLRPNKLSYDWINKSHSTCIINDSMEMRQGKFDYNNIGPTKPIDSEILSSLSNHALNYLTNFPDPTGNNFSFAERKSYYFDILKYWNTVINNLKPDIFVSSVVPHTPTCLSLYLLCKHHYNIDILFINNFPQLNINSYMISTSLEKYESLSKLYRSKESISPGSVSTNYLESIRKKDAHMPNHIKKDYELFEQTSKISLRLKQFCGIIMRTLKNGYGFKKDVDWKKNIKPYHNIKSRMNNLENFFFIERLRYKNKKLKKIYDKFVRKVDYDKKYIYFAAQYQPEATNSQVGSYFEDFFLVLDILSNAIPNDWVIYYKEHPLMFSNSYLTKGALRRDKHYFKRLAQYENVKMISENTNTFDLIDNAQAVSTVTGSVAWEAAVRGVPSMSFGSIWYAECDSIFSIKSFDDAKKAINKIINGYKPDQKDIERYTACIEKLASNEILPYDRINITMFASENIDQKLILTAEKIYKSYIENYP